MVLCQKRCEHFRQSDLCEACSEDIITYAIWQRDFQSVAKSQSVIDLRPWLFKTLFTKKYIMSQHGSEVVNGSQILKKLSAAVEYRSPGHKYRLQEEIQGFPTKPACQILSGHKSK